MATTASIDMDSKRSIGSSIIVRPKRLRIRAELVGALAVTFSALMIGAKAQGGGTIGVDGSTPPTYHHDVAPLMLKHCVACHHDDPSAPFSLLTYTDVRRRAGLIAQVTSSRYMPPWQPEPGYGDFVGSRRLSNSEISTIQLWVAAGALEGDPTGVPEAATQNIPAKRGRPDLVVRMATPFMLPADGPDIFHNFVIPVPVDTARFVEAVEFNPGAVQAVHHATILVDTTRVSRQRAGRNALDFAGNIPPTADYPDGHFLGWAPGQQTPPPLPGVAWRLQPGSDFVVQLHLKPTGKVEHVQASIGLFLTNNPPLRRLSLLRLSRQDLEIRAGEASVVVTDSYVLPVDVDVYSLQPHTHYRAKTVEARASLPTGATEWLIRIPDWDFNWQDMYYYRQPLHLPKGTVLSMRYTFDNSADNPRNPQLPPRHVRWGPTSTDEMADLLVQLVARSPSERTVLEQEIGRKHRQDEIVGREAQLAEDGSQPDVHEDLALLYEAAGRIDAALPHIQEAARLTPGSAVRQANLGRALAKAGHVGDASAAYERSLSLTSTDAGIHNDLAVLLVLQGRLTDAMVHYRRALELDPAHGNVHSNMATLLLHLRSIQEAFAHARRAVELKPDLPEAHYNLARAMLALGRPVEAAGEFRQALRLRPDWPSALKDFAWLLATDPDEHRRAPSQAVRLASRAVELTYRMQPALLDVLAAAYASDKDFERALATIQEALRLVAPDDPGVEGMTIRLRLYQRHQPFIAVPPAASPQ